MSVARGPSVNPIMMPHEHLGVDWCFAALARYCM